MSFVKKNKSLKNSFQELREKWLDFLLFTNGTEKNNSLLFEYYAKEFTNTPRRFYNFIHLLYNYLRTSGNDENKILIAQKYIDVLSPLCQHFGFYEEKNMLDNLCFKIINPEQYDLINENLMKYRKKSKTLIAEINQKLVKLLRSNKFKVEINGRYKTTYSIYKKMQLRQFREIRNLGDIFAFRIIVKNNSIKDCFEIVNLLHNAFYPLPNRFKDYISIPKINGYQSLHTGLNRVITQLDLPIEIQIRTSTMEEFAEKGIAAHWLYSKTKLSKMLTDKEKKLVEHFYLKDEKCDIYFFAYNGDLYKLKQGACILDFAYRIHTAIGNNLLTVFVNEKPQDFGYVIQEGDKIKLVTDSKKHVARDWLQYTQNKHTRKHISYETRTS